VNAHTLATLFEKGYRLQNFTLTHRGGPTTNPVGVGLFEKRGDFFESVVFERFGTWLYATPEKFEREEM